MLDIELPPTVSRHAGVHVHAFTRTDGRPWYPVMDKMRFGDIARWCVPCEVWWAQRGKDDHECWCCGVEGKIVASFLS